MKKFFSLLLILTWHFGIAQIVNDSANLIIDPGSKLLIEDDFYNVNSGIVQNDGTLEITGDFLNNASYQRSAESNVQFSGSGSSTWTSGGSVFNKAVINKSSGYNVILGDDLVLDSILEFQSTDNKFVLGSFLLTLGKSQKIIGFGSNNYIQADDVGKIRKEFGALGTLGFPIGDVDEYSPLSVELIAGTPGSAASISVNVKDDIHPNLPVDAVDYVSRYWNLDTFDIPGFEANLNGMYHQNDVVGQEFRIYGASYDGSDWNYLNGSADSIANSAFVRINTAGSFTASNRFGLFDYIKVFLEGPYLGGGTMTTHLNTNHLLPGQDVLNSANPLAPLFGVSTTVGQPYSGSPWNYNGTEGHQYGDPSTNPGSISYPPTVVDWILISIRAEDSLGTSTIYKCACLLHDDGSITVPEDCGVINLSGPGPFYILFEHRNHLISMSTAVQSSNNPGLNYDFTQNDSWIGEIVPGFSFGVGQKLNSGTYLMYGSNGLNNPLEEQFDINSLDYTNWNLNQNVILKYSSADHNLDADINSIDNTLWRINFNNVTLIPR
jgi:hypothetical protein